MFNNLIIPLISLKMTEFTNLDFVFFEENIWGREKWTTCILSPAIPLEVLTLEIRYVHNFKIGWEIKKLYTKVQSFRFFSTPFNVCRKNVREIHICIQIITVIMKSKLDSKIGPENKQNHKLRLILHEYLYRTISRTVLSI